MGSRWYGLCAPPARTGDGDVWDFRAFWRGRGERHGPSLTDCDARRCAWDYALERPPHAPATAPVHAVQSIDVLHEALAGAPQYRIVIF
mmetsp:Transcript_33195/g.54495  ORF Transcript_33195/g.54495 Transcript_33195/m.54495 type:complete len:89 (+) Transcript_33195:194-460(+)